MWTVGYSQKKRLGFQEKRMNLGEGLKFVKTILFAVFVLNKCCNALGIFLKISGQQLIFHVMYSRTERIILEGIKLICKQ